VQLEKFALERYFHQDKENNEK